MPDSVRSPVLRCLIYTVAAADDGMVGFQQLMTAGWLCLRHGFDLWMRGFFSVRPAVEGHLIFLICCWF
jgi:hypothetical protein